MPSPRGLGWMASRLRFSLMMSSYLMSLRSLFASKSTRIWSGVMRRLCSRVTKSIPSRAAIIIIIIITINTENSKLLIFIFLFLKSFLVILGINWRLIWSNERTLFVVNNTLKLNFSFFDFSTIHSVKINKISFFLSVLFIY